MHLNDCYAEIYRGDVDSSAYLYVTAFIHFGESYVPGST
jgi:hypothetical protein